jgi:hypothetical protein
MPLTHNIFLSLRIIFGLICAKCWKGSKFLQKANIARLVNKVLYRFLPLQRQTLTKCLKSVDDLSGLGSS